LGHNRSTLENTLSSHRSQPVLMLTIHTLTFSKTLRATRKRLLGQKDAELRAIF
jgi:hypothetical protein